MKAKIAYFALASFLLVGCFENEGNRSACTEQGVVQKGESNWVHLEDSTFGYKLVTRYPIAVSAKVFDLNKQLLNEFNFDIDSQQFAELPIRNDKYKALVVLWDYRKKDGSNFEGGCYKIQLNVTAPTVNLLSDDIPSSNKIGVLLEINKEVYPIEK